MKVALRILAFVAITTLSSCTLLLDLMSEDYSEPTICLSYNCGTGLLGCSRIVLDYSNCSNQHINSFSVNVRSFDSNGNCIDNSSFSISEGLSPGGCGSDNFCVGYYDDFSYFTADVSGVDY